MEESRSAARADGLISLAQIRGILLQAGRHNARKQHSSHMDRSTRRRQSANAGTSRWRPRKTASPPAHPQPHAPSVPCVRSRRRARLTNQRPANTPDLLVANLRFPRDRGQETSRRVKAGYEPLPRRSVARTRRRAKAGVSGRGSRGPTGRGCRECRSGDERDLASRGSKTRFLIRCVLQCPGFGGRVSRSRGCHPKRALGSASALAMATEPADG